ncbi:MAG: DMT family transporter [Rikenellaceae bacterium]
MKYNLALLCANTLFALNYSLFVSVMERDSLSIECIYLLQTLIFGVAMVLWQLLSRGHLTISLRDFCAIGAVAILSSMGWSYLMLKGMSLSSPIDAAIIASVGPSLTLIFAHFMGRRRLTRGRISGVAISLSGVAILVVSRGSALMQSANVGGNLMLIVAVVIAALNTLLLKPLLERYGLAQIALCYAVVASIVALTLFGRELHFSPLGTLKPWNLVELIALLLFGSALPLLLLFEGTEFLSPLHTSLYRYMQPLIAAIVVVARGQATLTLANYLAMAALLLGGVLVAQKVDREG